VREVGQLPEQQGGVWQFWPSECGVCSGLGEQGQSGAVSKWKRAGGVEIVDRRRIS
jgi:hypothetical protein